MGQGFNRLVFGAVAMLAVVGCNTTAKQDVKRVEISPTATGVKPGIAKVKFALAGLQSGIRRGEPIFGFPAGTETSGQFCNHRARGDTTVTYGGGRDFLGDWSTEFGTVFFEELSRMGYKIAGDPSNLFHQRRDAQSAEYQVAGRLTGMKGNFCQEHSFWDGSPLDTFSGEMSVDLEWSVLDSRTEKIVMSTKTTGYFKQQKPIKRGIAVTFNNAFANAIQALGADNRMRKLAVGNDGLSGAQLASRQTGLSIENGKPVDVSDLNDLARSVVTVRIGGGHGSGFFIGSEGLVLTNAHVVGEANTVQVVTASGIEIQADVVARHEIRDIAVLRTPLRIQNPPELRLDLPGVTDTVFAVGSPLDEELQATVTRGIVSALRRDQRSELTILQADVAVSGGNSGGPLFDSDGRVVAVTVAKFTGGSGLNLFIPIGDALEKLGIQLN